MFTFFDLETTDKNPASAEILTGYFLTVDENYNKLDDLYVEARPELYSFDAYEIHNISENQANNFPDKKYALRNIARYINKHKNDYFVCHANYLVFGIHGYYDWQVLKKEFHYHSHVAYYWFLNITRNITVLSTHTLAKKKIKLKRYGLNDLAHYYGIEFKHHNCIEDTKTTMKIFKELKNYKGEFSNESILENP